MNETSRVLTEEIDNYCRGWGNAYPHIVDLARGASARIKELEFEIEVLDPLKYLVQNHPLFYRVYTAELRRRSAGKPSSEGSATPEDPASRPLSPERVDEVFGLADWL